ncbi:DMT family transporter [Paratractidigestivibacter sp.]|uniref:DMT family transporter n=1 Tax=Paratractidigestivibacter sp. TaxID=2847316 RepID=UPI002ABE0895|nr:DMT family transporter [Paratractidigestivibacter sp.]
MDNATKKYLLSLVLFGSNGIVANMIDLPSNLIVLVRVTLGAALLVALVALSRDARKNLQAPKHRRQAAYLATSGAALGVAWLFLFESYKHIGVGVASLLFYCGPVIVMALSPMIFKARLTAIKICGFAAVILGAFLVVGQGLGQGIAPMGLLLGAMSAVMYAVMVIFSKKVTDIGGAESSAIQLCGSFGAVAAYMVASALTGSLALPSMAALANVNLAAVLCIGLVNTGFGCYLYFSSMGKLPVTRVAVCGYLEPLSAVVLSAVLLGEPMSAANVLGACLILGGAIWSELGEKISVRGRVRRLAAA